MHVFVVAYIFKYLNNVISSNSLLVRDTVRCTNNCAAAENKHVYTDSTKHQGIYGYSYNSVVYPDILKKKLS